MGSLKGADLNIYDMRFTKVGMETPQRLRLHEADKKVLRGAFWEEDQIVSIATDNKCVMTNFRLSN